jgi:hypothetical protein
LLNNPRQRPAKNPNPGADDAQAKHNPTEIPHLPSPHENRPPQERSYGDSLQDPVGQGEEAVNAAYLPVKKEPNPKVVDGNIWIPYQKVTKENYESFMKS